MTKCFSQWVSGTSRKFQDHRFQRNIQITLETDEPVPAHAPTHHNNGQLVILGIQQHKTIIANDGKSVQDPGIGCSAYMTPDEARELARELVIQADALDLLAAFA